MKSVYVVAALVAAFSSAQARPCDGEDYAKMAPLANDENLSPCQAKTGFSMVPPTGYPTPEQYKVMCVEEVCLKLMKNVFAASLPDCDMDLNGVVFNAKTLADAFEPNCKKYVPTTAPPTEPATKPVEPTTAPPTTKPVPPTQKPPTQAPPTQKPNATTVSPPTQKPTPAPSTANPAC